MALRNQKVLITSGNGQVTKLSNSVTIPTLSELTMCFEVERLSWKEVQNVQVCLSSIAVFVYDVTQLKGKIWKNLRNKMCSDVT